MPVTDWVALFEPIQSYVIGAVTAIIPLGLAVMGLTMAVRVGSRLIRGLAR